MTCCPHICERRSATSRNRASGEPPGAECVMIRTGLVGKSCVCALARLATAGSAAAPAARRKNSRRRSFMASHAGSNPASYHAVAPATSTFEILPIVTAPIGAPRRLQQKKVVRCLQQSAIVVSGEEVSYAIQAQKHCRARHSAWWQCFWACIAYDT